MKLIKSLLFSCLLVAVFFIAGCNETPTNEITGTNQQLSKTANTAMLYIYNTSANLQTVNIYGVTSDWTESKVTFNNQPTVGPVEASFVTNVSGDWIPVNITGLVNKWLDGTYDVNRGLLLFSEGENLERFDSREGTNKPYLVITYSDGTTETVIDTADAFITQLEPAINYGSIVYLYAGIENTYEKKSLLKFGNEPEATCETAYAKADNGICFLTLSPISANNWGWTNLITPGYTGSWPMYAGAGQCDISKGTLVGHVDVSYIDGTITVDYVLDQGFNLSETHVWIGSDKLPVKKGVYQTAPGKFNYNGLDPVVLTGQTGDKYVAVHAGVCWFE